MQKLMGLLSGWLLHTHHHLHNPHFYMKTKWNKTRPLINMLGRSAVSMPALITWWAAGVSNATCLVAAVPNPGRRLPLSPPPTWAPVLGLLGFSAGFLHSTDCQEDMRNESPSPYPWKCWHFQCNRRFCFYLLLFYFFRSLLVSWPGEQSVPATYLFIWFNSVYYLLYSVLIENINR